MATIKYQPDKVLKRLATKKQIERLVTKKLTVNKIALNAIARAGVLSKKELEEVALRVIKQYKQKQKQLQKDGKSKTKALAGALNEKKQLVHQVQDAFVGEITERIKENYQGTRYRWLKSTAKNPDPAHRRKYGRIYVLGRGESPGERYGCKCGMEIVTNDKRLNLGV